MKKYFSCDLYYKLNFYIVRGTSQVDLGKNSDHNLGDESILPK